MAGDVFIIFIATQAVENCLFAMQTELNAQKAMSRKNNTVLALKELPNTLTRWGDFALFVRTQSENDRFPGLAQMHVRLLGELRGGMGADRRVLLRGGKD